MQITPRIRWAGAAALCLLAACCGASPKKAAHPRPAPPAAKPSPAALQAQDEIQALYAQQDNAFAQKNIDGMFAACAPDFVSVDVDGKTTTIPEARQALIRVLPLMGSNAQASIIQSVAMDGDNAIVTVSQHTDMILRRPSDGALGRLVDDVLARDYWVKTPGGWQATRSRNLTEKETINGKPAPKR